MNGIFGIANEYVRQCDWKDLALIKFCLCAMGVLIGIAIPVRSRKKTALIAMVIFIATYIPLMQKLFLVMGLTDKHYI